jgi:hypothetical protein
VLNMLFEAKHIALPKDSTSDLPKIWNNFSSVVVCRHIVQHLCSRMKSRPHWGFCKAVRVQ